MDLATLRLFVDVAERLSFASVARDRSLDPSVVSREIAGLEAKLGTRLFQRTTRVMTLTEAGEAYLAAIKPHVDGLEAAEDTLAEAAREPEGLLRVTASAALGETLLVPLMPRFQAALPRLQVELLLTDANVDLVAERVDIAIRLAPSFRADVIGVKLFPTRYHVVASPHYVERYGRLNRPEDLSERQCLLFALPEIRTRWIFATRGEPQEVAVQGRLISSNATALRLAALAGLGPALLADWLISDDLASGALIDLLPDHRATPTSFDTAAWLLYPSRAYMPRKTRSAIDFFKDQLKGGKPVARSGD
jgi:DNA-binding transcriptional LysR family regulator